MIKPTNELSHSLNDKQIDILLDFSKAFHIVFHRKLLFKGELSGLRQFLVTESSLKIMKNAFYFTLNPLFIFKIFKF